jgi:hypothetical protein
MNQGGTGIRREQCDDRQAPPSDTARSGQPETEKVLAILEDLGLKPLPGGALQAAGSILVPATGSGGHDFLLKYYLPCPQPCYEPGPDPDCRSRERESSFYRYLDVVDRDRCFANIPRMVLVDQAAIPGWILLEGIPGARTAATGELRPDWLVDTLRSLQDFPARLTDGRRGLILERWDPYAHREVIFQMRDRVEPRVGQQGWDLLCRTLNEAREWTESTAPILVNGWFQENTLLVDEGGRIYQHEFRRVGLGSRNIDFAWFWLSCRQDREWKENLYHIYCSGMETSARLRVDWAARSVAIYLACLQVAGSGDEEDISSSLELLERGILGGTQLLP